VTIVRAGRKGFVAMLLALQCAVVPLAARAQAPETALQVNSFRGAGNLPIWIAQHEGLFARRGIAVALSYPNGSVDQFKGLAEGRYPVVVSAFDNIVAYHSGQGPAEVGAITDLVAVMGIDSGFLSLMASPDIEQVKDLRGRKLAVDSLTTGFSFALRDILQRAGLKETDVTFVPFGNSDGRWKAMHDGKADAALLTLPADLDAIDHGYNTLTTMGASFGRYLGNVVAVRQAWGNGHRTELQAFLRGVRDGVAWLLVPEHKLRAVEILSTEMPALDPFNLERVYEALVEPRQGLNRTGALDPEAARSVLALRAKYSGPTQTLQEPEAYSDTRFLAAEPPPR
jgi:ABC-type nitrate/sulfonate/bicarbonate transport system substrate-binding protein